MYEIITRNNITSKSLTQGIGKREAYKMTSRSKIFKGPTKTAKRNRRQDNKYPWHKRFVP